MAYICKVCNYDGLFEPPYDEEDIPSDEICPCCGFHYGYDDDRGEESLLEWKARWISEGCPWFSKSRKAPKNWKPNI